MKHTLTVTNGQQMAVAKYQAEKTGRSWFALAMKDNGFFHKVVDAVGRRGLEQYMALEYRPDGSTQIHESAPRA